jgi:hypothetical protein
MLDIVYYVIKKTRCQGYYEVDVCVCVCVCVCLFIEEA